MEILKGIYTKGSALFIKWIKAIVVSDLQLGREEQMRKAGLFILNNDLSTFKKTINDLIEKTNAKILIINGDLKHEFGTINIQERRQIRSLLTSLKRRVKIIIIKGNHDILLEPIAKLAGIPVRKTYYNKKERIYFCHGHEIPRDKNIDEADTIIIGHEHPSLLLDDSIRQERVKCFLVGKYKRKNLVVMPSFSGIGTGTNILDDRFLSPFLKNIERFKIYVPLDKTLFFGTVKDIKRKIDMIKR